jgi:hypothetical protein
LEKWQEEYQRKAGFSTTKLSAIDYHEQLGGDGVPSKCTTKFGSDGGGKFMPMSMHIAPKCCVAQQSKSFVGRRYIYNFKTCRNIS